MGSLLVVTGPPGAGKSTVAAILANRVEPSVLVEGDAFFAFLARGRIEPWLPESHAQNTVVTEAAAATAGRFAAGGFATVYDGVLGAWFLPTFIAATGLDELDYVIILPSVGTCLHRVATRQGHGFTDEAAARKMHHEFAKASIADRHVLDDTNGTADAVAGRITEAQRAGRLRYEATGA